MRAGYVYVIQAIGRGWVKIGWAKDIARRMCTVATGTGHDLTLLGSLRGTQADEANLQRRFASDRIARDWFIPSPAILAFANDLPPLIQISFVGAVHRAHRGYLLGRLQDATGGRAGPHQHLAGTPRTG